MAQVVSGTAADWAKTGTLACSWSRTTDLAAALQNLGATEAAAKVSDVHINRLMHDAGLPLPGR